MSDLMIQHWLRPQNLHRLKGIELSLNFFELQRGEAVYETTLDGGFFGYSWNIRLTNYFSPAYQGYVPGKFRIGDLENKKNSLGITNQRILNWKLEIARGGIVHSDSTIGISATECWEFKPINVLW